MREILSFQGQAEADVVPVRHRNSGGVIMMIAYLVIAFVAFVICAVFSDGDMFVALILGLLWPAALLVLLAMLVVTVVAGAFMAIWRAIR